MSEFFPAKLSAMEEFLFLDSRPSHPLDFIYHLHFDACPNVDRLRAAFYRAVEFHPLMSAIVVRRRNSYYWDRADLPAVCTIERRLPTGHQPQSTAIDLTAEPGVRLCISDRGTSAECTFQFHHCVTDGLGAFGFISDVFLMYAHLLNPDSPLPVRQISRLRERHWCGYQSATLLQMIQKQLHAVYVSRSFLNCRICPLVPHQPDIKTARTPDDFPRRLSYHLSAAETQQLRNAAANADVTVNSVLVRDAFIAAEQARKQFDDYDSEAYIRIAVPGSIRSTPTNKGLPSANFFSMVFPAKNAAQISEPESLLQSVHTEIREATQNYFLATFILGLKLLRCIPGALKRMVDVDRCQNTLLLTNVGRAFRELPGAKNQSGLSMDGARLLRVEVMAPMRPYQSLAICTLEYRGQQTITLTYDPRIHNDAEAARFLQSYVDQLRSHRD